MKKRLLTGIQASGTLHIGNYFGALKPFVDVYKDYESHLMVADLHALTTVRDPKILRQNIVDVVKDYIAVGVNPEESVMFKQSDVQEHTELAWMFECLVTVPFLSQAHAYKDKVAKGIEANAGLFNYPMLMAADILLYDTDVVPVGEDQRQHIEYAREAASKFNIAYGETFTPPQEMILKGVGIVPGTDGQKMSKSYKNTVPLFGSKIEITKGGSIYKTIYADDNGNFNYTLDPDNNYTVKVSIGSYVSKIITISTENTPGDDEVKENFKAKTEFRIFKRIPDIDYSVLDGPIGSIFFDADEKKFDYNVVDFGGSG